MTRSSAAASGAALDALLLDPRYKNLNQMLLAAMDAYPNQTCLRSRVGRHYSGITYRRFQTRVFRLAHAFLNLGLQPGDRVVLAADTVLDWMVVYMATLFSGGIIVPLRTSVSPDVLHFILQDTEATVAVLKEEICLARTIADTEGMSPRLPHLKAVFALNDLLEQPGGIRALRSLLAESGRLAAAAEKAVRERAAAMQPQDRASIWYLNSETSWPKGAVFTQQQHLAMVRHMGTWFPLDEDDLGLNLSAWSEFPSLATTLYYFVCGLPSISLSETHAQVLDTMQQNSPTILLAPPFAFEQFYEFWMNWLAEQPDANQTVFQWALAKGKEYHAAGDAASPELRQEYVRADLTFFSQIRGQLGGRLHTLYATGAPLDPELADFFDSIGLPVLNVYSLTEAGGFPAISRQNSRRAGSCGQVLPGYEIDIAEDGEVLVRGGMVAAEYWHRPEETRKTRDLGGALLSGDIGYFDEDGFLFITGRKQHLLVLSTGRKIVPANIEAMLVQSPYIAHATIVGDGKPYLSALIVPDLDELGRHFSDIDDATLDAETANKTNWFWHSEHPGHEMTITSAHPTVKALVDGVIEEVNQHLDETEKIRQYSLLDQAFSKTANEFAETLAFGREVLAERYATEIATMYPHIPQVSENTVTQVQINPERLRELLEKESILDAWMADAGIEFLFELAREKRIDIPSMVNICDAAASIAQMKHEEKPLSTAFIVGDPSRIARTLPPSQVQLLYHDHIRRMRRVLISMAAVVDGVVLGYAVDRYGFVRGINRLEIDLETPPSFLLGPQFRHHAAISSQCDAIVFFVPSGGQQVRVFANGQLIGRFSHGDWSPENMDHIDQVIAVLAEQETYSLPILRRVLKSAFTMSEQNLGAIFVIGDADTILRHSDVSEISSFAAITSARLDDLSDRELINFAKQDGATIIDQKGFFRGCMVLLRPNAETQAEIGPGKGARHSSAAKMSAEVKCLAITVSQDGPITIYSRGRQVLSL